MKHHTVMLNSAAMETRTRDLVIQRSQKHLPLSHPEAALIDKNTLSKAMIYVMGTH